MDKRNLVAYGLTEYTDRGGSKKTKWTLCGAAFENRDGSINVELDAFPRSGRIQIRPYDRDDQRDDRDDRRGDGGERRGR